MPKLTSLTRELFAHAIGATTMGVLFAFLALTFLPLLNHSTPKATAAVPSTLNFQARLLSSNGSIVPDGYYNVEFKLYDAQSGGTNVWTETWYDSNGVTAGNDNRIQVKNGYLSVYLGDINTNLATLDWTQQHWLTMNVGGTTQTATPTYDGEMSPRLRLTSVPYAQAAADSDKLDGIDSTGFAQLAPSGLQNVNSANTALRINQQGAGNLLQFQTGGVDQLTLSNGGALSVTGAGTFGGTLTLSNVTTDITTGANEDLTVVANGSGIINLNDTLQVGGPATFNGSQLTNNGATLNTAFAISDVASGGDIGTAAATVDIYTTFNINQTTASQTLTLPAPTSTTAGRMVYVNNVGSASFTMYGSVISAGKSNAFIWNGTSWVTTVSLSGSVVNAIGTIDSQSKSADGAVISTSAIYLQTADATYPGLVSTGTQTFAGDKTFNGSVVLGDNSADTLTITGTSVSIPNSLNFDSNTLYIDATNNRVGIGTSTPSTTLSLGASATSSIEMGTPGTPTPVASGSGGSLATNTYYYKIVATGMSLFLGAAFENGTTLPSTEASVAVTGPNGSVTLTWPGVPGAFNYRVYRGTSSDGQNGYYTVPVLSCGTTAGVCTFVDTGTATTAGTPPTSTTAYALNESATGMRASGTSGFIGYGSSVPSIFGFSAGITGVAGNGYAGYFTQAASGNTSPIILARLVSGGTSDIFQAQDAAGAILMRISYTGVIGSADVSVAATNSAATTIRTGNSTTSGNTGILTLATGNATSGDSGNIVIDSGTATGTTGSISIGTTNSRSITIGNTTGATALSLQSGTGNIDIGTGAQARTINLGTGTAVVQTIAIGGTGANVITLGNTQTGGSISLGNALTTGTLNLGSTGAQTGNITIGNGTSTGQIQIGNSTGTGQITLGGSTGARTIAIGGTGANTIQLGNSQTGGSISLGAAMTTGTINIGGTGAQTGTITLGGGTGAQTINLATGGTGAKTVTVGSTASTSSLVLQSGTGDVAIQSQDDINIGTNAIAQDITVGNTTGATSVSIQSGTGAIQIGTGAQSRNIQIGTGAAAQSITIGSSTSSSSLSLQAGTGGVSIGTSDIANTITIGATGSPSNTQTINIGTGNGNKTISIGNVFDGNTSISAGGSSRTLSLQSGNAGTIAIGTSNVNNEVKIGNDSGSTSQTIYLGQSGTGLVQIQAKATGQINLGTWNANTIGIGSTDASTTVSLQAGGGINIGTSAASQAITIGNSTGGAIRVGQNGGTLQLDGTNFDLSTAGVVTLAGGQTNDITTATTNSNLTLQANGTGQIILNDTVQVATLGSADTDTFLCRNSSNQLATCNSTPLTSSTAFIQGGNSYTAAAVLGTNDSYSLSFETAGVTQATLAVGGAMTFQNSTDTTAGFRVMDADGGTPILNVDTTNERVGIGVAAPSYTLDIQGTFRVANSAATPTLRLDNQAADNFASITNPGASGNGELAFNTGTGEAVRILNGGNVGIGTNNPGAKLEVQGELRVSNPSSSPAIRLNNQAGSNWSYITNQGSGGNSELSFLSGGGEAIRILSNMNVGIGDTSPAAMFTVGNGDLFQVSSAGALTFNGVATDITTGTNEDLTVVANGTGQIILNDTVQVATLGSADTDTVLCRNSSNQLATCSSTFASSATAFIQNGNSFGATAVLGTNDSNSLAFETAGVTQLTLDTTGNLILAEGADKTISLATPTTNIDGNSLTVSAAAGGAGSSATFGGDLNLYAGNAGGTTGDSDGGTVKIQSGNAVGGGDGGSILLWAGSSDSGGAGGEISIEGGTGNFDDNGGNVNIEGGYADGLGLGGELWLQGGESALGDGGALTLYGGDGGLNGGTVYIGGGWADSTGNGGNVYIDGGYAQGSGTNGIIALQSSGGSVAVGTSSVAFPFANTEGIDVRNNAVGGVAALQLMGDGAGMLILGDSSAARWHIENDANDYYSLTQTGVAQRFTISTAGNVGIGLYSSTARLGVQGDTGGSADTLRANNSTSTGNIFVAQDNGSSVFTIADGGAVSSTSAASTTFSVVNSGSGNAVVGDAQGAGVGVFGRSSTGMSGFFQSSNSANTNPTLVAQQNGASTANLFQANNSSSTALFSIDYNGTATFNGVATDITTGTNEDLTVVANGTGVINLNDTVAIGTLAATDTDSYALCRDASSGQLTACDANTTGKPFLQGGNSFGGTATLGTNDTQSLAFETNGNTQVTINSSGGVTFQNSFDTSSAFRILNQAGGTPVLNLDNTTDELRIEIANFIVDNASYFEFTATDINFFGNTDIVGTLQLSAATDLTTSTNEDLTVVANGTGIIYLNDTVAIGTLGTADTDSYALCRDASSGQLTACDANTTGKPFLQGGNSFGAAAILGTNDANSLSFETGGTTRLTLDAAAATLTGQGATTFTSTGTMTISSATTNAISLDSGTTGAVNVGTGANAKTVTVGSTTGASILNLQAGTGTAAGDINLTTAAGGIINVGTSAVNNKVVNIGSTGSVVNNSTVNIASTNGNATQAVNIGNTGSANNVVLIQGGTSSTAIQLQTGANGVISLANNTNAATVNIGTGGTGVKTITLGGTAANVITIGNTQTAGSISLGAAMTTGTINIGGTGAQTGTIDIGVGTGAQAINLGTGGTGAKTVALGSTASTSTTTINAGSGGILLNSTTAQFTEVTGTRTLGVQTRTTNVAGSGLTISAGAAGSGASAFSGGALTLQGGAAAGTGNANGGNVLLSGGAGTGTGTQGLVVINNATYQTATVQNFTGSGSITQANLDSNSAILISSNAAGYTATMGDPTITTAGRVVYVTNSGLYDMTLSVNGGGTGNTVTLKPNTTATMIWNGSDWTAAGASSSTDLQAAYNNTATSAGGAELVLNAPGGSADGLTIRNNATTPITGGILEVQSSIGTNLFSVNNLGTELAANGGAETSSTFSTNWTGAPAGGSVSRTTTAGQYVTGQAGAAITTTSTTLTGARNNLSGNPVNTIGAEYQVSFAAKSSINGTQVQVQYTRDGGTNFDSCTDYGTGVSYSTLSDTEWTKVTCTITISSATAATNPDLIIQKIGATTPTIYIDNLSFIRNDSTTEPSNVQIGGGINGGQVTLFTLDRSSAPPVANGNETYLGSMYYDTTTGRIQCYESDGWGACGSAPDNFVNLVPEYPGAVLNGSGVGTMTADFCANETGVLSVNSSFCSTGQALNYYRWTSPQATQQTYSIYVTYQLPAAFKNFSSDSTVTLTARTDSTTNGVVTYEMFRSEGGTLYACGSETTVTSVANTWQTVGINGNESTTCGFSSSSANANVIFKINVKANSNANVYVGTLSFTSVGQ